MSSNGAPHAPLGLRLGDHFTLALHGRQETLTLEVGLLGEWVLASNSGGRLRVQLSPSGYVAHNAFGPADSVVQLLRACLPRLPLDDAAELHFEDLVANFWTLGPSMRWLSGLSDVLSKSALGIACGSSLGGRRAAWSSRDGASSRLLVGQILRGRSLLSEGRGSAPGRR